MSDEPRFALEPGPASAASGADGARAARPAVLTLPADLLTPLGALERLRADEPAASLFLFESVEGGERIGRYSYVGRLGAPVRTLEALRAVARAPLVREPGWPRFLGGAVVLLGWDLVRDLEPILRAGRSAAAAEGGAAPVEAYEVRELVAFDHVKQRVHLVGERPAALEALARVLERPLVGVSRRLVPAAGPAPDGAVSATLDGAGYRAAVRRAKEYIAAGDIFQVVLSRGFSRRAAASGLDIYRALRVVNPSPYMFYVGRPGARELAGASPEMLLRVEAGLATTHPIAGTRPRDPDGSADDALARDLLADPKERAEHAMLVDLARNDLGRVARPGTVRVARHMEVERYSHVLHLVSEVEGRLAADRDPIDALAACFPAGTLSGAPKVRAMQIIDELEPAPRGLYGGAVGYVGFGGSLDTAIAIRAVEVDGAAGRARWQAGAGIVADSDPGREVEETEAKARAMLRAIDLAEAGL